MLRGAPTYVASFTAVALSTAGPSDLFHITAPSNSRVAIEEIRLGQFSEFGDAQAELMSMTLLTGTTSAAVGSTLTPRNIRRHTGAPKAGTQVSGPSTTVASTASAVVMLADSFNVFWGWNLDESKSSHLVLNPGERAVLRVSTPNDAISLNGTVKFQEIGG